MAHRLHWRVSLVCAGLLLGASASISYAQTEHPPEALNAVSLSTYGTLGYTASSEDRLRFARDTSQTAALLAPGSWGPDTRLGVQGNWRFTPHLEGTVQVVARDKTNNRLNNSVEWAYLDWRPNDAWQARVGRLGLDVFMQADYRNIGYAQTTVRPNWEFYGYLPIYAVHGADISYHLRDADTQWILKSQVGDTRSNVAMSRGTYSLDTRGLWNISVARENGPWRIKGGYAQFTVQNEPDLAVLTQPLLQLSQLTSVPSAIRAEAAALQREMHFQGGKVRYFALGTAYDDGVWQFQAEISRLLGERRIFTGGTAAYMTLGRRWGAWLPYVGLSSFDPQSNAQTAQLDWSLLGPAAVQLQAGAILATNAARMDQKTMTVGVRWDVHPTAALKIQWDHIRTQAGGMGMWTAPADWGNGGARVNLLSTTLDWAF